MTFSIKGLFATLGITTLCNERQYAERHDTECRILVIVMLYVIMLSVVAPLGYLPLIFTLPIETTLR